MIYTLEELKVIVMPMVATAVHDALDDKPPAVVIESVTDAIIEVIKQDREAHEHTDTKMAANDD